MKVFFSYARSDAEFALKLAKDLKSAGIDVWLDQLDINPGGRWDDAVENALKACPRFLIILSPASVASQNVMDEVSFAIENDKKIVPVLYKNCDIPFRLKRLQYIDFTRNYNEAITRLLPVLADNSPSFPLPKKNPGTATLTKRTKIVLAAFILLGTLGGAWLLTKPPISGPKGAEESKNPVIAQNIPYSRGVKNLQASRCDLAINDFTQVIIGNPNHSNAYYNRAVCYQKLGQKDRAIDDFNKFLELSNDASLREKAIYNLGILKGK